jgi:hypothetical protein
VADIDHSEEALGDSDDSKFSILDEYPCGVMCENGRLHGTNCECKGTENQCASCQTPRGPPNSVDIIVCFDQCLT